ncbi:zinc finger BED domain-containing protein 3-like [Ixodes scapularis]
MQMCENGARSTPAVATPATGGPSQSTSTDGANGSDRTRSPPPPRARTAALRGKKKTRDGDVAAFLQQRSHQERAIRERELDIEERRLALDEKRLEFERERFAEEAQARAEERRELSEQRRIMFEFLLGQAKRN